MSVTINQVHDAMVAEIGQIDGVLHCGRYAGEIRLDEVMKTSFKAPAVLVAYGGAPQLQKTPEGFHSGDHIWAAFIVIAGKTKDPHKDAIDLAWKVADAIDLNTWGFNSANEVEPGRIDGVDNLYSLAHTEKNVALYAVRFTHRIIVGTNTFEDDLAATSGNFDEITEIPVGEITLGQHMQNISLDGTGDTVDAGTEDATEDVNQ